MLSMNEANKHLKLQPDQEFVCNPSSITHTRLAISMTEGPGCHSKQWYLMMAACRQ